MTPILYRPAKIRAFAFLGLLLLALVILGVMNWRNLQRFDKIISYVNNSHRVQNVVVGLQLSLIRFLTETHPSGVNITLHEIDVLMANNHYLAKSTIDNILVAREMIADIGNMKKYEKNSHLISALKLLSQTLDEETIKRETLLEDINIDTQFELYIALLVFTLIVLGALLFLYFRILHPLNDLRKFLECLADGDFTPITTDHLDPLLVPVFSSYNQMVTHLVELEETKRLYAQSLQSEVRLATQALLEQQNSLARAERLAAVGEVAAELAHEIRNPIAGIQMAFSNLRRVINDESQYERMEMIASELKRLSRLLNEILDQSRHTPEPATDFDLSVLVRELVTLTRYQISTSIQLIVNVPDCLFVHLPESGVRQALLNLILNSAEAISERSGLICVNTYLNGTGLHIEVRDNGSGFSQDMLDFGIRPFRTSHQRGTGLGLSMVQRFVKDIGGIIKLHNQQPNGACVTLFIPGQKPQESFYD
jgi:signal transduction histidine kinase